MFTGIISDVGTILEVTQMGDTRYVIETSYDTKGIDIGASIACSGVCLTVIEKMETPSPRFAVEASAETLNVTTAKKWAVGTKLNLERALKMGDELGGHIVSGHVDGLAEVLSIQAVGDSHVVWFRAPRSLARFVAAKGSVALDGVSLTVNAVDGTDFSVNVIQHTWDVTTLGRLQAGSKLNMEIDMLARYV
ncbi:MAG TPA: riboflavin synthase, partial [Rhodobiaceae bacterium]|nr:riboflavin synthase [Rhodobiaceae bacterium]